MWVLSRNAIKAASPDWAAQLQECWCRVWGRGECDNIFELSLFTHLSTKIKIQQPRGAESRSVRLQRAGRTDLLLPPLGEPPAFRGDEEDPRSEGAGRYEEGAPDAIRLERKKKTPLRN